MKNKIIVFSFLPTFLGKSEGKKKILSENCYTKLSSDNIYILWEQKVSISRVLFLFLVETESSFSVVLMEKWIMLKMNKNWWSNPGDVNETHKSIHNLI